MKILITGCHGQVGQALSQHLQGLGGVRAAILPLGLERLDLAAIGSLDFEAPDNERFPAIALARAALEAGQGTTAVLNAANEVAVQRFLDGRIGFLDIAKLVEETLARVVARPVRTLDDFRDLDTETRAVTESLVKSGS